MEGLQFRKELPALDLTQVFTVDFWYPVGSNYGEVLKDTSLKLPRASDVWIALYIAIIMTVVRLLCNYFLFRPFALKCLPTKIVDRFYMNIPENDVLEKAFKKKGKKIHFKQLSADSGLSQADALSWFQMRRQKEKAETAVTKFTETLFRAIFYTSIAVGGFYVLWDKPWFGNLSNCWVGYPRQELDDGVKYYYLFSLGHYMHSVIALFIETRKKDFLEMLVHHISTIILVGFSYWTNFVRIGTAILLTHDVSDPFMEVAKLFNYSKWQKTTDTLFACFATVFFVSRLIFYPIYLMPAALFDSYAECGAFSSWYLFNMLLVILFFLHCYWFYLIAKMIYKFLVLGELADERSQTDDSEAEAAEMSTINKKNQ